MLQQFYNLLLVFLISSLTVFSSTFSVKTVKGDVKFQKSGKGDWISITKGQSLENGDQLKLAKGSHLNLVHENGNPIEVSKSSKLFAKEFAFSKFKPNLRT